MCGTGVRDYGLAPQHEGQTITSHVFHCKVSVDSVRAPLSGPLKLALLFILSPLDHCSLTTFSWGYKHMN